MIVDITTENLVSAVQRVILDYEAQNGLSTQAIADKAKSGYTTIREIKNGKLKSLSIKKSLEISKNLSGPSTLEELMSLSDISKEKAEDFKARFSHLFDYNVMPEKYEDFVANKDFAKILWAAFGTSNITREEIRYRWGKEGEDRLEVLLDAGLVIEEDGLIKGVVEMAGAGIKSAYNQLGIGYGLYNISHARKQENWVSFQTNSVNDKFITDMREVIRGVFKTFGEKSNAPEYIGNKRMFFGMIFDRFLEDLNGNDGETLQ